MSTIMTQSIKLFRERLEELTREELLQLIADQDIDYIKQIDRIEYVFKYKLRHITWADGTPVQGRNLTMEELRLLIDPPFIYDKELSKLGFNEESQRQIHIASDPVLWAKHFLKDKPRVYQTLVLRDPNTRKVMRFGRRMGKSTAMAFFCLWYAYTNNEARIIIVAPMKSHVALIYDEILRMAKQNDLILSLDEKGCAIIRKVASPQYQIDFNNGATIKFFTTGMKSNSKADVARGQEADVIILDEMDYMGKDDLVALLAMLQTTSERKTTKKQLIGASTPTGQRNTFWEWNTNPSYKFSSYWFPCYVNPLWDKDTEEMMRIDYPNEQAYKHEVEADWGEDVEGVYPHKFLKLAFIDPGWSYELPEPNKDVDYVIGVDWDKYGAGVNIVMLELATNTHEVEEYANKIRLSFREEIPKGDFTYDNAVRRIIELNGIYRPKHIYVDRGAGEMQIEMLHKYGMDNPQSGMHKVLQGLQFAESREVRDPYTKEGVKKRLKVLMVDNLYRLLERENIIFSGQDDELNKALLSYVVLRMSQTTGEPIFAAGGNTTDHAHDALILACYAIADNYDELLNPKYGNKSFAVSNEPFLPTFTLTNQDKIDDMEVEYGKGGGPVRIVRPMAFNLRRSNRSPIQRKMF